MACPPCGMRVLVSTSSQLCRVDAAVAARLRAQRLQCVRPPRSAACRASAVLATEAAPHVHAVQCYIEYTDCFQVVYYANYFRFCAQAREAALGAALLRDVLRNADGRMAVLSVTGGRLASPAVLGDLLAVRSYVVAADGARLVFRQAVSPAAAPPGSKPHAVCDVTVGFTHARTGELLPLPAALAVPAMPAPPPHDPVLPFADNAAVAETRVPLCGDELGPGGLPSETDVLRWFERNRTDAIGGGAGLRALQAAGVLVVVTSVGPVQVDTRAMAAVARGEIAEVVVRSGVVARRKGTFFVFREEAYAAGEGGALLAQGEVTCACVSAADMRLCPAPQALLARLAPDG